MPEQMKLCFGIPDNDTLDMKLARHGALSWQEKRIARIGMTKQLIMDETPSFVVLFGHAQGLQCN